MLELRRIKTSALTLFKDAAAYETVVVMPSIDMPLAEKAADVMARRTDRPGLLLLAEDDSRLGFIMTVNMLYARTKSDYFVYVAQDAYPGYHWLDYGLETLEKTGSGLLAFNDGRFFGKLAVFGLARRAWAQSIYRNFIFYPEYKSHFADTELSMIALQTGQLSHNPYSILMEVDYEKHLHGNNPVDHELYRKRAASGFDGRIAPFNPD